MKNYLDEKIKGEMEESKAVTQFINMLRATKGQRVTSSIFIAELKISSGDFNNMISTINSHYGSIVIESERSAGSGWSRRLSDSSASYLDEKYGEVDQISLEAESKSSKIINYLRENVGEEGVTFNKMAVDIGVAPLAVKQVIASDEMPYNIDFIGKKIKLGSLKEGYTALPIRVVSKNLTMQQVIKLMAIQYVKMRCSSQQLISESVKLNAH